MKKVKERVSRVQLFATLWTNSPGSLVHGILQARILGWVAIPSPGDLPNAGIESGLLHRRWVGSLLSEPPGKPEAVTSLFCLLTFTNYSCMQIYNFGPSSDIWLYFYDCTYNSSTYLEWGGKWQPTVVFLPGESHGQRSLVGYSPRGRKESGMTEWLNNNILRKYTVYSIS